MKAIITVTNPPRIEFDGNREDFGDMMKVINEHFWDLIAKTPPQSKKAAEPTSDVPAGILVSKGTRLGIHFGTREIGEYDENWNLLRTHKMAPNANLPGSLAELQNCGKPRLTPEQREAKAQTHLRKELGRIDVTDGQTYETSDVSDFQDGIYQVGSDLTIDERPIIQVEVRDGIWYDKGKPQGSKGFWSRIRYAGPLPEAEPMPQGLPSAEELVELYRQVYDFLPRSTIVKDVEETAMQAVIDKVLQAVATKYSLGMAKEDIVTHNVELLQQNHALEVKVRELEAERGSHNVFWGKPFDAAIKWYADSLRNSEVRIAQLEKENQNLSDIGAEETLRAEKAEAKLAALGTPIDPSTLNVGDIVLLRCEIHTLGCANGAYPASVQIEEIGQKDIGTVASPRLPTFYPLPNAPTE